MSVIIFWNSSHFVSLCISSTDTFWFFDGQCGGDEGMVRVTTFFRLTSPVFRDSRGVYYCEGQIQDSFPVFGCFGAVGERAGGVL